MHVNCHESGYHSLQLHITHGLHLPSCTAHTHSRLLIVCCLPLWPRLFNGNPLCLPPALTPCSASDYDSAFSTLPSIPLLDICLFDLVQIKLLVDLLSPLTCHLLHKWTNLNNCMHKKGKKKANLFTFNDYIIYFL